LESEIHAAAQIESQGHRAQSERSEPRGRAWRERLRDRIGGKSLAEQVIGTQLYVEISEPYQRRVPLQTRVDESDAGIAQRSLELGDHRRSDGLAVRARYLHGRIIRERVRQRDERAEHHDDEHQPVDPTRIAIHLRVKRA
jgi:hypothetical protein